MSDLAQRVKALLAPDDGLSLGYNTGVRAALKEIESVSQSPTSADMRVSGVDGWKELAAQQNALLGNIKKSHTPLTYFPAYRGAVELLSQRYEAMLSASPPPPTPQGGSASDDDDGDFVGCETCDDVRVPHEDAIYSEGCYFCPKCHAEWKKEFDACAHEWSPHVNEHGEDCHICQKCNGIDPESLPRIDTSPQSTPTPDIRGSGVDGWREVLAALVAKLEALTPEINAMFQLAQIHGASWPADKNWVKELADAKAMLSASPPPTSQGEIEHDFPDCFGVCRGCGRFIEHCIELRYCDGNALKTKPTPEPAVLHGGDLGVALTSIIDRVSSAHKAVIEGRKNSAEDYLMDAIQQLSALRRSRPSPAAKDMKDSAVELGAKALALRYGARPETLDLPQHSDAPESPPMWRLYEKSARAVIDATLRADLDAKPDVIATHNGFVIGDGSLPTRWMHWYQCGPVYKADPWTALRFARREDADAFGGENLDAWRVVSLDEALALYERSQGGK